MFVYFWCYELLISDVLYRCNDPLYSSGPPPYTDRTVQSGRDPALYINNSERTPRTRDHVYSGNRDSSNKSLSSPRESGYGDRTPRSRDPVYGSGGGGQEAVYGDRPVQQQREPLYIERSSSGLPRSAAINFNKLVFLSKHK